MLSQKQFTLKNFRMTTNFFLLLEVSEADIAIDLCDELISLILYSLEMLIYNL